MNGEQLKDYVRFRVADHGLDNYVNGNRALRRYCQSAGYPWLKDIEGALIKFKADQADYVLGEIGLRSIRKVWVQDSTSLEWTAIEPLEDTQFEAAVADAANEDAEETSDTDDPPSGYILHGPDRLTLRIVPTPTVDVEGRISGIANTPVIERSKELPGPSDYHEIIGNLWIGFELQHQALTLLRGASAQFEMEKALQLRVNGQGEENRAMEQLRLLVRDSFNQDRVSLDAPKQRLMR